MGEIITVGKLAESELWSDQETCYKVASFKIESSGKKKSVVVDLERIKPFPHFGGYLDTYNFQIIKDDFDPVKCHVDLGDFFQTARPLDDEV